MMVNISVIVATFNERENLREIIENIHNVLRSNYEIIVVDDNSPDGTYNLAEELAKKYPVKPLLRDKRLGLASAIVYGFERARGDILCVMDADLQHPPELLGDLCKLIEDDFDVAVASRYLKPGGVDNWKKSRTAISRGAYILAKPLVQITDPVSGYFCVQRSVIEGIQFKAIGYKILLEILVKGKYNKIKEIDYVFRRRGGGKSKFGYKEIINYLELIAHLYIYVIFKKLKVS